MQQSTHDMITSHPRPTNMFRLEDLAACLDACMDCIAACTACADACLAENEAQYLIRCIRLNLDCTDICTATRAVLMRRTMRDATVQRAQLEACMAACRACWEECAVHAHNMNMVHCAVCAEACRRLENACNQLINNVIA